MVTLLTSLMLSAAPTPVLVELFTSEGCSSCPPADQALAFLADKQPVGGVEVVALSFHVDYWNRLGWADPFSRAQYSERQSVYARGSGEVYTPQMVVDGEAAFVGSQRAALAALEKKKGAPRVSLPLSVRAKGRALEVTVAVPAGLEVWVALAEDGLVSRVTAGENEGKTLPHAWVVRQLVSGAKGAVTLELPRGSRPEKLRVVAIAQGAGQGRVEGLAWAAVPASAP